MSNNKPVILVIDDTPSNLMTLGTTLSREFDLQIATSGAMGLSLAVNTPPDLILLDVMMPEMDGFETCQRLKADPKLKNVPVIFVTALNDPLSETRGLDLGAADYITKPINVGIARQRIRNLLEREHLRKEVEAQLIERQRVQIALQESEQRFRHFFEKNSSVMLLIDPFTGVIDEANEAAATYYGYAKAHLVGMRISEINTLPAERISEERQLALHEQRNYFLFPHRLASGEIRDVEVHSTPIETGGRRMLFSIVHDITERKQAEQALHESYEALNSILDTTLDGFWWTDLQGNLLDVNQTYCRQSGYSREELLGLKISNLDATERPDFVAERIQHLVKYGRELFESRHRRKDGSFWHVEVSTTYRDVAGGQIFVFLRDITLRKRAETELDEHRHHLEEQVEVRTMALSIAKEAAESANRAKSTFLANMSHELRTPMNGIMGMTSLAQRRATDPKLLEVLGKVMQSSQRLLEIINNILDISKIEAEQMILDPVDFTLDRVIEELNTLTSFDTKKKGLSLTISTSPDLGQRHLRGDALRLGQVLLNLTGNAIKFTTAGSVTVSANLVKQNSMGVVVRFEVLDTGIGIPQEIQDRIFNPFEQADGSTTRNFGGTGLGLAICKQLVHVMGGNIGVESQVGVGSKFWFTAQFENIDSALEMEFPPTSASAELELLSNYFGMLILLAEDDPICQEIAMALMNDAGLQVDLAKDGCQAIEMATQTEYDLILMDMQMPKMNGIEATKAIRALPFRKNIPILAMTANAFTEDRARCFAAGMDDFIAKPVDPDALFAVLLKWLSRQQR